MKNICIKKTLNIGIDGNLLVGQRTGMGNVLYNIIKEFYNNDYKYEFTIYIPNNSSKELIEFIKARGFKVRVLKKTNYVFWEQFILPYYAVKDDIDIMWFPYNTGSLFIRCKTIITIHDMIFMENNNMNFKAKTLYKRFGAIYRKFIVPKVAKKSYKIITVSEQSKKDIIKYLPSEVNKISVIYNGCKLKKSYLSNNEWNSFKDSNNINNEYILAFGSIETRKNSMMTLRVFEKIKKNYKQNIDLVFFGFKGWRNSEEYKYVLENKISNVIFLEYISEEELNSLYKNAKVFMYISLYEGFGLPVLEAMNNKTLVITSNTSCLPEIAGNAAILVNPLDEDNICYNLNRCINNEIEYKKMIDNGIERVKIFKWDKTAKEVLSVLTN